MLFFAKSRGYDHGQGHARGKGHGYPHGHKHTYSILFLFNFCPCLSRQQQNLLYSEKICGQLKYAYFLDTIVYLNCSSPYTCLVARYRDQGCSSPTSGHDNVVSSTQSSCVYKPSKMPNFMLLCKYTVIMLRSYYFNCNYFNMFRA